MNKPGNVDDDAMLGLPVYIYNVCPIGNNSYRGSTLSDSPSSLKILKKAGIKTVIDLAGYGSNYEDETKNAGLDYFRFDMKSSDSHFQNIWLHSVFDNGQGKNDRMFIGEFVKFIQTMQKGYCYIGCEFGTQDTSDALLLYDIFSPKSGNNPDINDEDHLDKIKVLYSKLNDKDKKLMGWTEEFDKNFLPKLKPSEEKLLREEEDLNDWLAKKFSKEEREEIEKLLKRNGTGIACK